MDFLLMSLMYCAIFIAGFMCLLYRDAPVLCTGPVGAVREMLIESLQRLIPTSLQGVLYKICSYLLYKRNCVFQLIYLSLNILAHSVWLIDMLPYLYDKYPDTNHTFWPFMAVFINYIFFHKAWTGNPGEITQRNHETFMKIYQFDDALYDKNAVCTTCKFIKPARSKHCSTCNRCVYRFDHHCIWTNNCVGGLNHRYFILFMVTIVTGFLQAIYVTGGCILDFAEDINLFNASYINKEGVVKPVTVSVAAQHLFMERPRLVFLEIALIVLTILVSLFLSQHLYLVFTNQTTNERHKAQVVTQKHIHKTSKNIKKHRSESDKFYLKNIGKVYRPYSRGIFNNILEVFFPHHFIDSRLKGR